MSNGLPKKRIALFGSTGSIGRQALEVIDANASAFSVEVLTAQSNDELLIKQAVHFKPEIVVIGDEKKYGNRKVGACWSSHQGICRGKGVGGSGFDGRL